MPQDKTIQLAKLFIALEETKARIYNEILPLCANLAPEETIEMVQSLEIAAEDISSHQNKWRLVAEKVVE